MTDRELAAQAEAGLRRTTVSYPEWVKRRAAGRYANDGAGTEWGKALAALAQIGTAAPPPPPPPPPPPVGQYGAELRKPFPEISGTYRDVTTLAQLNAAANDPAVSKVRIVGTIGGTFETSRRNPFHIEGGRIGSIRLDGASGIRIRNVDIGGEHDGIKAFNNCDSIDIDRCVIHDTRNQGFSQQAGGTNIVVRNTRFLRCGLTGTEPANQRHAIYLQDGVGVLVASCHFEDTQAFCVQAYPNPDDVVVTGCTMVGGRSRGGIVSEGTRIKVVGCVVQDSPAESYTNYAGQTAFDCIAINSAGQAFYGGGYTHCLEDANPKNFVPAARYGLLPATDIDGKPRVTADAGAFALA